MKHIFAVEIEAPKNISKADFDCCVRRGMMQYYADLSEFSYEVTKQIAASQNVSNALKINDLETDADKLVAAIRRDVPACKMQGLAWEERHQGIG